MSSVEEMDQNVEAEFGVCPKDGGTGRFHYSPPCGRCPHKTMTLSR